MIATASDLQRDIRTELELVRKLEHDLYILMMKKDQVLSESLEMFNNDINELELKLNETKEGLNKMSEEMVVTIQLAKETHLKHQLLKESEDNNSNVRQTRRTHFNFHEIKWKLGWVGNRISTDLKICCRKLAGDINISTMTPKLQRIKEMQH